jgi:serine phosphatase RsbU (regulator of sigma subunit)/TPR repeat protein
MRKIVLLTILSFWQLDFTIAQKSNKDRKIDSLQNVIKTAKHDSIVLKAWQKWDDLIYISDPKLDRDLNYKIDSLSALNLKKKLSEKEKRFFLEKKSTALNNLGIIAWDNAEYKKSIEYHLKSLKIRREIGDKKGEASSLNNIGLNYKSQGDYDKTLEYYTKSLLIQEKTGYQPGISSSLNNIGNLFWETGDFDKAIEYYNKSLIIQEKAGDKKGMSVTMNNLGNIYDDQKKLDKAIQYFNKSVLLKEEIGDAKGLAITFNNIGAVYSSKNDYSKAISYFQKSIAKGEESGDKQSLASSYNHLGRAYFEMNNLKEALKYGEKSFEIAVEIESVNEKRNSSELLYLIFKKNNSFKEALTKFEQFISIRDTMLSENNKNDLLQLEFKMAYQKQAAADSVKNAEKQKLNDVEMAKQKAEADKTEAELKNKRFQQYGLIGGLIMLLVFLGFLYNRFRITNQQKKIIELQKSEVENQKIVVEQAHSQLEEKNNEILDSIKYAKRIQEAILPSRSSLNENLKNGFVLYKPKDIVAGDFYWLEKYKNQLFLAAADCTGHGVPGAMVSVVCSNALSKALLEEGITNTGKILDRTRELVIEKFSKSEENVQDGMDISLVSFNLDFTDIRWSGANNPLWIIRNGELIEIKPDKQPIGNYSNSKPFSSHSIEILKGDTIYLFTDGYQDQFGGEKARPDDSVGRGKKFKAAKFKELLLSIQDKSMEDQKKMIDSSFEKWRGDIEQNDDVCVIGIKI